MNKEWQFQSYVNTTIKSKVLQIKNESLTIKKLKKYSYEEQLKLLSFSLRFVLLYTS